MLTSQSYLKVAVPLLFAFVLTLPLANRDIFSIFVSRLFPVRLVLLGLIGLSIFSCFYKYLMSSNKISWLKKIAGELARDFVFKILISLWMVRIISVKNSLNLKASFDLILFYSSVIALYLILKYFFENQKKTLGQLLNFHFVVVSGVVLYGVLQLILAFFGWRLPGVLLGSTFVRIPATFYDTNHLPAYILTALPSLLIIIFYQKLESRKFFLSILLGLYCLVTLFTFSRSGFLSFSLVLVFLSLVFLKRKYWRKFLMILGTFCLVGVIIYLTSQTQLSIFKRLSSVFNLEDKSTVAHGLLWFGGLQLFTQSPVIGLGYGSFSEHFRASDIGFQHGLFDAATAVRIPAHSIWLEVLVESGLLGLALYLWFMLSVLEKAWRALKIIKDPKIFLLQISLVASFMGLLVSGLFYSYNLEFFWFFIFIVYFQSRSVLESKTDLQGADVTAEVTKESAEKISLKTPSYFLCLLIILISLIFTANGVLPVLPGTEGFLADVGKVMRINWGYGVKDWWVPRYLDRIVFQAPLPFFLVAFWTVLFDYGASIIRFFPAFFGSLSVLLFFYLQKDRRGSSFAFLSTLLLLCAPGFIGSLRAGGLFGYLIFFNLAVISLSWLIVKKKKTFLLGLLIFVLALLALTNYAAFILIFIPHFAWSIIQFKKKEIPFWFLPVLLTSLLPAGLWIWQFGGMAKNISLLRIISESLELAGLWQLIYLLILPFGVFLVSEGVYSFRRRWFTLILIGLTLFGFYRSFQSSVRYELSGLVQARLALNRDGRVPLFLVGTPGADLYYYAEVPLYQISAQDLKEKINSPEHFYAIVEGPILKEFKNQDVSNYFVVKVEKAWVLIEKPGRN